MPGIALDKAYLTAIWLETMFYGMNLVLFGTCISILTIKRRTPKVNRILVSIAVAMFTFSTAHVSLGFQRLIEGFIVLRDAPGGPAAFFSNVSIPANVVKVGIHTVNSIIGDSVVVWRCYLVWGRDWKMCVVPVAFVTGSAVCGFAQTFYFARAKDVHSAFAHTLEVWNGSLFSLSLATNVIVTSLVATRVWYMLRQAGGPANFQYWRVLLIVVESGMIYSLALLCEIVLYFINSNAFYIVYDPIAQLTAIVPTMIIVLAGLELTSNDVQSRLSKLSRPVFRSGGSGGGVSSSGDDSYSGSGFAGEGIGGGPRTIPLDTMQFAPGVARGFKSDDTNKSEQIHIGMGNLLVGAATAVETRNSVNLPSERIKTPSGSPFSPV